MKIQIRLNEWLCLEGLGWASLNTGLHGSMAVMIDLHGSSANMQNLLRICSGPANRLKETIQLAEYDGKPVWVNHIMISVSLPGTDLETQLHRSDQQNTVPCRLIYGLNWPMLKSMYESSNLMMDNAVREVAPRNGTGHRIPDERKKKICLLRCRTDSEDVPVHWAAPCDIFLMLHPSGGRGTRRANNYHCQH